MDPLRPSVSRETRLLLTIVVISVALLWILARIRFPGRATTQNPVPPVLAQLAPPSAFEDITSTVAQLTPRIGELIAPITVLSGNGSGPPSIVTQALRLGDDLAVTFIGERDQPRTDSGVPIEMAGHDAVTGLTLLKIADEDTPSINVWTSRGLEYPRFLIACDVSTGHSSLRPVFIGSLTAISTPRWPGSLWAIPSGSNIRAGTFLFTLTGELAGVAVSHANDTAIVPGELLMKSVETLSRQPRPNRASIGADVQALTPTLSTALRTQSGVVITWVDPAGPAAGLLWPMDVVDHVNGAAVTSPDQWEAQVLGLADGSTAVLDLQRQGKPQQVRVVAHQETSSAGDPVLGLTLRYLPTVGAEVLHVLPRSAAARAGLQSGDIITRAADVDAPSSAVISRLFTARAPGESVIVAVTRDRDHRVVAIEKAP